MVHVPKSSCRKNETFTIEYEQNKQERSQSTAETDPGRTKIENQAKKAIKLRLNLFFCNGDSQTFACGAERGVGVGGASAQISRIYDFLQLGYSLKISTWLRLVGVATRNGASLGGSKSNFYFYLSILFRWVDLVDAISHLKRSCGASAKTPQKHRKHLPPTHW